MKIQIRNFFSPGLSSLVILTLLNPVIIHASNYSNSVERIYCGNTHLEQVCLAKSNASEKFYISRQEINNSSTLRFTQLKSEASPVNVDVETISYFSAGEVEVKKDASGILVPKEKITHYKFNSKDFTMEITSDPKTFGYYKEQTLKMNVFHEDFLVE